MLIEDCLSAQIRQMASFRLTKRFEPTVEPLVSYAHGTTCHAAADHKASIIAVQGLWANPNYTWTNNGINWLEDLLPDDVPFARIFSFEPQRTPRYSLLKANKQHAVHLCCTVALFLTVFSWRSAGVTSLLTGSVGIVSLIAPLIGALQTVRHKLAETSGTELEDEAHQLAVCVEKQRREDVKCHSLHHGISVDIRT